MAMSLSAAALLMACDRAVFELAGKAAINSSLVTCKRPLAICCCNQGLTPRVCILCWQYYTKNNKYCKHNNNLFYLTVWVIEPYHLLSIIYFFDIEHARHSHHGVVNYSYSNRDITVVEVFLFFDRDWDTCFLHTQLQCLAIKITNVRKHSQCCILARVRACGTAFHRARNFPHPVQSNKTNL